MNDEEILKNARLYGKFIPITPPKSGQKGFYKLLSNNSIEYPMVDYTGAEISEKQQHILGYIIFRQAFFGETPTYKEIAQYIGKNISTVRDHIEALSKKKLLKKNNKKGSFRVKVAIHLYQFRD